MKERILPFIDYISTYKKKKILRKSYPKTFDVFIGNLPQDTEKVSRSSDTCVS